MQRQDEPTRCLESGNTRGEIRWPWALLVLGLLGAGAVGYAALQATKPVPSVKPMVRQVPVVRIAPITFTSDALPVIGSGLIKARAQITIAAEVSGRVTALHPQLVAGGRITAGDALLSIDPAPFEFALAQAAADRQSAEAALALAAQSITRTRSLINQGFQSRQSLDERLASRDQAQAGLARARAIEKQRSFDLARTVITAPLNGRVLSQNISLGDTVQPGRELARVFDDSDLELPVSLTAADMALVDEPWDYRGQRHAAAIIEVGHGGNVYAWPGTVERIDAALDPTNRTFNVFVKATAPLLPGTPASELAPRGPPLMVGMYATARIAGRDLGEYAVLPREALRSGDTLWLMTQDNRVTIVTTEIIAELDDQVALRFDKIANVRGIITSDLKVVTPGMAVRLIDGNALPVGNDDGNPKGNGSGSVRGPIQTPEAQGQRAGPV